MKNFTIPTLLFFSFLTNMNWAQKHFPAVPFDTAMYEQKKAFLANENPKANSNINVILIVADDLGKHDLSIYGNPFIQTPNIDQLAKEGLLFNSGYASASVCSPSRAGFMTGRYQQRFGYHLQPHPRYPKNKTELWLFQNLINTSYLKPENYAPYPHKKESLKGLPPSEITISELLKSNGYQTAWIGKWHLGYKEPLLPQNFGFDYRYGCYEAYTLFADPKDKNIVNARINEFTDKVIWKGARKGACAIRENETIIDEKEYITYAFFNKAQQFIAQNKNNPFFVYLPITAPHTPYQAPKNIYDQLSHIPEHNKRVYYAMVIALDNAVGQLVQYLKAENIYDNTLIIFTSDNGAALYSNTVDNLPLNGGKMTLFEGGINVPFIMTCKNLIKEPHFIETPVSLLDIFATIADATQSNLPEDRIYDGVSLLDITPHSPIERDALYWYSDYNLAIQKDKYKLIVNTKNNTIDLYNLTADRGEKTNISKQSPGETQQLQELLTKWLEKMPRMYWPRIMNYEIYINGELYQWAV